MNWTQQSNWNIQVGIKSSMIAEYFAAFLFCFGETHNRMHYFELECEIGENIF